MLSSSNWEAKTWQHDKAKGLANKKNSMSSQVKGIISVIFRCCVSFQFGVGGWVYS